jgi:hypothetical protein
MNRQLLLLAASMFCACGPSDYCRSIALGSRADALPLHGASLDSQGGVFDTNFVPTEWTGPHEFRCCYGDARGRQLAGCPVKSECAGFDDAEVMSVGAPFSGGQSLGAYFCQVAVRDQKVVSLWCRYND